MALGRLPSAESPLQVFVPDCFTALGFQALFAGGVVIIASELINASQSKPSGPALTRVHASSDVQVKIDRKAYKPDYGQG